MNIQLLDEAAMDEMDSDELTVNIDDIANWLRSSMSAIDLVANQVETLEANLKVMREERDEAMEYHTLLWDKRMIALRRERSF